MTNAIITTTNLTKEYNGRRVVDNVTLQINQGEICGLVGKNGAGKTTLMRLLTGLITPTQGSFAVCPNQTRTDTTVSALIESPSLYGGLSGMDNLRAQARLLGLPNDEGYFAKTLEIVGLPNTNQKASTYSLGMKQRLAIALALLGKPSLVLLDEPTNGLDPQGIVDLRQLFVKLNRDFGITFVISSHILSELGKFATSYCFVNNGKLIKQATASEVDAACKKFVRVHLEDVPTAFALLKQAGYTVEGRVGQVDVLDENAQIVDVVTILSQGGVVVNNVQTQSQTLEDYFIALLRGEQR
jgi:ABC-2 type transport system ATP-binding protein